MNFFLQQANQPNLISKIKQCILMYNNLIFDDGAYMFACTEYGTFDLNIPPQYLEKFKLPIPSEPMTSFGLDATDNATGREFNVIPPSETGSTYFAIPCFRQLIDDLGIQDKDFIRFEWVQLSPVGEEKLSRIFELTRDDKRFIEGHPLFQNKVLRNFHYSLITSKNFDTPMVVDSLHDNLLTNIMSNIFRISDVRLEVLNRISDLLKFNIPDFSTMGMDEILNLRNDSLFIRFRNKLLDISNYLTQHKANQFELSKIDSLFVRDLITEMNEIAPSTKKLVMSGFFGVAECLPVIGPIATGAELTTEVKELLKFRKSWLAFIFKNH